VTIFFRKLLNGKTLNKPTLKSLFFFYLFCIGLTQLTAQTMSSTIEKGNFLGRTSYYYNNRLLLMPGGFLMNNSNNEDINVAVKKARTNLYPGTLLSIAGGLIITDALIHKGFSNLFGDSHTNTTLPLIAGLAMIGASVPLQMAYNKHIERGVQLFNNDAMQPKSAEKINLLIGVTENGVGLTVMF
jgi:hypothetical protein